MLRLSAIIILCAVAAGCATSLRDRAWGNVFSRVELPTLLHNPNIHTINFRNPTPPPDDTHTWALGSDECWRGPDVPPGAPAAPGARYPQVPGFRLDSLAGVHRFT